MVKYCFARHRSCYSMDVFVYIMAASYTFITLLFIDATCSRTCDIWFDIVRYISSYLGQSRIMSEKKLQPSRIARPSALTQALSNTSPSSSASSSRAQSQLYFHISVCFIIRSENHFSAVLSVVAMKSWPGAVLDQMQRRKWTGLDTYSEELMTALPDKYYGGRAGWPKNASERYQNDTWEKNVDNRFCS